MGIIEIISDVFDALGKAGQIALVVIVVGILFFGAVLPIASMAWENRKEIANEAENLAEIGVEGGLAVYEASKVYCEIDDTLLFQLRPNTIESYMLNNVEPRERTILGNWKDSGDITACEIKILDENIDDIYKDRLNLKSVTKSIVGCNLVECLDKYKIIENLDSENAD